MILAGVSDEDVEKAAEFWGDEFPNPIHHPIQAASRVLWWKKLFSHTDTRELIKSPTDDPEKDQ